MPANSPPDLKQFTDSALFGSQWEKLGADADEPERRHKGADQSETGVQCGNVITLPARRHCE